MPKTIRLSAHRNT